jgi:hypothetical protein
MSGGGGGLKEQLHAKLGLAASEPWLQRCVAFLAAQDPGFHSYDSMRQMALVLSQILPSDLHAASDGSLPDVQVRAAAAQKRAAARGALIALRPAAGAAQPAARGQAPAAGGRGRQHRGGRQGAVRRAAPRRAAPRRAAAPPRAGAGLTARAAATPQVPGRQGLQVPQAQPDRRCGAALLPGPRWPHLLLLCCSPGIKEPAALRAPQASAT